MDAQTPTVRAVARDLGDQPVPAAQVVDAILARHTSDYPSGFVVQWPGTPRLAPVERWLEEARELLTTHGHPELHGRAVILALALADPPSGRALVRSGLFAALAAQLKPRLVEGLTPTGLERLDQIPLIGAMEGVAMGAVTLRGPINAVAFSPNAQLLVAGWGSERGGWTLLTRARRREIRTVEGLPPVTHAGFSRDGREILAGIGESFGFYDLRGRELHTVRAGAGPLAVATGLGVCEGFVYVGRRPDRPFASLTAAAIAPGAGVIAGADREGTVLVWRAEDGEELGRIGVGDVVTSLALSADGAVLATRGVAGSAVWDVASGRQISAVGMGEEGAIALSPDGRRLATGGYGVLLDAQGGEVIAGFNADIGAVAFSPDGKLLATGGTDGTVRIWNPETGVEMAVLRHTAPITTLTWDPEGEQLVTGTTAGTLAAWAVSLDPAKRRRVATYSADDTLAAEDFTKRLEIDPDVDALATLIAARAVQPPLSVGLFGDWGSGKTFFMRRLSGRVAELAADARDSGQLQKEVSWHKRIVQIEFNAWHYAEGNLWASLVEHILDNLRLSPDEPRNLVERRRKEVVERIGHQEGVAEVARDQAKRSLAAVTQRREELDRALVELEHDDELQHASPLSSVRAAVLAAVGAVVTPRDHADDDTVAKLSSALDETRATLTRGSEVLVPLLHARDRRGRYLQLLAVLALAPLLAWLVGLVAPGAVETLTGLVALLAGAAEWLRRQAEWTRRRLDDVQRATDELEAPLRQLRESRELEVRRLQEEHDAAARAAVDEEARLRDLERELAEVTPSRLLARLIADRVESGDYRRHLGVLALVRRDFEAMSDYLRLQADEIEDFETLDDEEADGEVRLGRIVLYIDDLDRCEPAQVVAVLQAVHLLLAFPLFTVVVGVDVRWVERALRLHHSELLDSGGAEPRDYLEKIFQIPFWLEPLDSNAARRMLRGILGTAPGAPARRVTRRTAAGCERRPGHQPRRRPRPSSPDDTPVEPPPPPAPSRDLQPASLEIRDEELKCMDALAPLLGRSPRALKRFINTYRLIKVRAEDPVAYLRDDPPLAPYRSVLLLLALSTGTPHTAAAFLDQALGGTAGTVEDALKGDDARVTDWLATTAADPWRAVELSALRPHAEEVVRFTFHWHGSQPAA